MASPVAVQVESLSKHFKKVQALRNVNLKAEGGQIFGLLGPNGAGKTTLIRLLIGAARKTSGRISVLGLEPQTQKWTLREKIGYMPQEPALYDDLSARDNIIFFGNAHRVENIPFLADQAIELVGLKERARDQVFTFSGGMKQRVSLACALVHQPQVLFLDEPTSGIDPQLREVFWQHFRMLSGQGKTIFISTHQMDEAMHCDQLAIIREGQLLACDTPRNIMWNGKARIRLWRGGQLEVSETGSYPSHLPGILQQYGLDPAISRIEVEEDTLEAIVLRMIHEHESGQNSEAHHDQVD
ncbi:MAG TPA: ABC transporter ATP-binding protein [Anaerolineaceae bacterium]|nr:ABC transporter ATP-binding protein [Anaerolineaceae bacterium]HQP09131.1 ABC transporter ATP-binding protein [Anaerolineaceae bacterium]